MRAFVLGCLGLLSLVGCAVSEAPEEKGDSQSNLVEVAGRGRLSLTVSIKEGIKGIPAHVTATCGGESVEGDADEEGILFPIVRPENCVVVAMIAATTDPAKKATPIELKHPGKAQEDTVVTGAAGGYTVTAAFAAPISQ